MNTTEQGVLREYARFIVHMRAEFSDHRLGMVLGAGVSRPLGFPSWTELVDRVAGHPGVDGCHVIDSTFDGLSNTAKTQMLFQHYRSKVLENSPGQATAKVERTIQGTWRRIIQECLYRGIEKANPLDRHP